MARVRLVVHKTWLVRDPPAALDAVIDQVIQSHGMTGTRVDDRIELTGGSSFKVKALGAKLTADSDLPRVGTIERSAGSGDGVTERITVHLEDRLNSAFIDSTIRQKYERVFLSIASSVEATLAGPRLDEANEPAEAEETEPNQSARRPDQPTVRPAGWWTDVSLGKLVSRCSVAGATRQDAGALIATETGIAFTGNPKAGCRWEDLADIEIIDVRRTLDAKRPISRFIRVTSRNGDAGEFWISGRAEPRAVYAIQALMQAAR